MDTVRATLVDHHLSEIRKHLDIARAAPTPDERLQKLVDRWEWSDFITQARVRFDRTGSPDPKARGLQTGAVAELCKEVARDRYDPYHPFVPWPVLMKRDVSVATQGGVYFLENLNAAIEEILRPWSITVAGGVQILSGLTGTTNIPKESTGTTGYWLTSETSTVSETTPSIGQIPMNPRMCGNLVDVSRLLRLQGKGFDQFIRDSLLRTIGVLVDVGVIAGHGTEQPNGIIGATNVGTATGTSLALSHILAARVAIATANADDARVTWIGPPAVRQLLAARQRFSGVNDPLWDEDMIDNRPAYVSTTVPDATLLCGDFSKVTLGLWGPGIQVEVTDMADVSHFKAGITTMRILASLDVALRAPSCLYVISSIT